jgi:hypothetical protein
MVNFCCGLYVQDVNALRELRQRILASSPSPDLAHVSGVTLLTWDNTTLDPCGVDDCAPCAPVNGVPCGIVVEGVGQTCNYPYIGCRNGRINKLATRERGSGNRCWEAVQYLHMTMQQPCCQHPCTCSMPGNGLVLTMCAA